MVLTGKLAEAVTLLYSIQEVPYLWVRYGLLLTNIFVVFRNPFGQMQV